MTASKLIDTFRQSQKHITLVTDEFGTIQGLVTLKDVLEAIVGTLPDREQARHPKARKTCRRIVDHGCGPGHR